MLTDDIRNSSVIKNCAMNIRAKLSPDQVRTNIMDVAEEHFRRVGYAKTAVADIAAALGMSPANVYRFFASKGAINEAICMRLLGEGHAIIEAIAAEPTPASDRLRKLIVEMHRFNRSRFVGERRVHDMVEAAMEENWAAVEAHFAFIIERIARIVADGVATGEFRPCPIQETALTIKQACASLFHPHLIAECMGHGRDMEEQARRIASFLANALKSNPT
jgi:AcrR family transcriptional regulator